MKTITSEQFRADSAGAWLEAERNGDVHVVDPDGRQRMVLHIPHDPNEKYWIDAMKKSRDLIAELNNLEISDEKKSELVQLVYTIWDGLSYASDFQYELGADYEY